MTAREREILYAICNCNSPKIVTVPEEKAFMAGAKWADATMINRACEWLKCEMSNYISYDGEIDEEFIADFRKAMED